MVETQPSDTESSTNGSPPQDHVRDPTVLREQLQHVGEPDPIRNIEFVLDNARVHNAVALVDDTVQPSDSESVNESVTGVGMPERVPAPPADNPVPSAATLPSNYGKTSHLLRASLTAERKRATALERSLTFQKKKVLTLQEKYDDCSLTHMKKAQAQKLRITQLQADAKAEKHNLQEEFKVREAPSKANLIGKGTRVKALEAKCRALATKITAADKATTKADNLCKAQQGKVSGLRDSVAESFRTCDGLKKQNRILEADVIKANRELGSNFSKKLDHDEKMAKIKLDLEVVGLTKQRERKEAGAEKRKSDLAGKKDYLAFQTKVRSDNKKNDFLLKQSDRNA